ncbi:hypothetical protein BT69DRAFT_236923 [Atractiella rhizophila]|nr:hypothetical protein BT69DRAFT_236923 [Atractiella rhizophila]
MTLRYHSSTHALIPFILLLLLLSQPSLSALDVPQPLIQCENTTIRDHSEAAREHPKWNLQVYFEGDVWWSELVPCHGEECEWRIDYPANSTIGFVFLFSFFVSSP